MTASTIAKMAWYMPKETTPITDFGDGSSSEDSIILDLDRSGSVVHFAKCFKNLRIGWDFASALAGDKSVQFPAIFHGSDLFIWRAYRFLEGDDDPDVAGAVAIEMGKSPGRDYIRAMLVNKDGDHGVVSSNTGIRKEVIKAYEKLFFNVRDRLDDHAFLASVVYPEGRIVEAFEDYVDRSGIGLLILRAGYSKGITHVTYAAGLTNAHPYAGYNAAEGASELDKLFMQDGVFIGSMGFMHQRHNNGAISNARLSMQASKMGNGDASANSMFDGIDKIALEELATLTKKKAYAISGMGDVEQ